MENSNEFSIREKTFFHPGEVVRLKQDIHNSPNMVVKTIDKVSKEFKKPTFLGVTCFWFTTLGEIQVHRFNSKDLISCEK